MSQTFGIDTATVDLTKNQLCPPCIRLLAENHLDYITHTRERLAKELAK